MKFNNALPVTTLLLILVMFVLTNGCSHRLQNGIYKGTGSITVSPDSQYWPGIFKNWISINDSINPRWYHEVSITLKDGKAILTKKPFYIKDGTRKYSDSTGGFYYYKADADYDKKDKTTMLFFRLDSCQFCPKLLTATPLYIYESYETRQQGKNLVVDTDSEKGLLFTRQ